MRQLLSVSEAFHEKDYHALRPVVAHIIRGYLEHNDLAFALDLLKSAQYSETIPPIDLAKLVIQKSIEKTTDPLLRSQAFAYLNCKISSGHWDDLVMQLLKCNFLEEAGSPSAYPSTGSNGFWEVLRVLLEDMTADPGARLELLTFLTNLWRRAMLRKTLGPLIASAIDDRRLRRKFITIHLYGLVGISPPEECPVVSELISLVFGGLFDQKDYYTSFLEECYESTVQLETDQATQLLQNLCWLPRVEILLLFLERRFRLGNGNSRSLSLLTRIREVLENLSKVRIENRNGVSRDLDPLIFKWMRMLLVGFVLGCAYESPRDHKVISLLSPADLASLLDDLRRLANSVEWPGAIRVMLRTTVRCMEKVCPDSVIVL